MVKGVIDGPKVIIISRWLLLFFLCRAVITFYLCWVQEKKSKQEKEKALFTFASLCCSCLCGSKFSMNSRTLTRNTTIFICDISIQLLLFVCFTTFLLSFRLTNYTLTVRVIPLHPLSSIIVLNVWDYVRIEILKFEKRQLGGFYSACCGYS